MTVSKAHILSQLKKDILLMQGFKPLSTIEENSALSIIRHAFPGAAFPLGAVHEFFCNGMEDAAASAGFVAGLVSSIMKAGAPSVWISPSKNIFPPALKVFGIEPHKILFIQARKTKQALWVMEEALKTDCIAAVIGEIGELSFLESRRLQLAVEGSKVTGFLLRQNPKNLATASVTRWKVKSLPSENESLPGIGFPKWKVELLKVRNGKPGCWQMAWHSGRFHLIQKQDFTDYEAQRKAV